MFRYLLDLATIISRCDIAMPRHHSHVRVVPSSIYLSYLLVPVTVSLLYGDSRNDRVLVLVDEGSVSRGGNGYIGEARIVRRVSLVDGIAQTKTIMTMSIRIFVEPAPEQISGGADVLAR